MSWGVCESIKTGTTLGTGVTATEGTTKGPLCLDFLCFRLSFSSRKHRGKHIRSKACDFNRVLFICKGCNETEALRRKTGLKFLTLVLELALRSQSCDWSRHSWGRGEGEHLLSESSGSGTVEPCAWLSSFNLYSNPEELSLLHSRLWMKTLTPRVCTLLNSGMHF